MAMIKHNGLWVYTHSKLGVSERELELAKILPGIITKTYTFMYEYGTNRIIPTEVHSRDINDDYQGLMVHCDVQFEDIRKENRNLSISSVEAIIEFLLKSREFSQQQAITYHSGKDFLGIALEKYFPK